MSMSSYYDNSSKTNLIYLNRLTSFTCDKKNSKNDLIKVYSNDINSYANDFNKKMSIEMDLRKNFSEFSHKKKNKDNNKEKDIHENYITFKNISGSDSIYSPPKNLRNKINEEKKETKQINNIFVNIEINTKETKENINNNEESTNKTKTSKNNEIINP